MRDLVRGLLTFGRDSARAARKEAQAAILAADAARDRSAWEEAAGLYRRAHEMLPHRNDLQVQYGNMLKESGALGEAEAAYRAAIAQDPDAADPRLQLGHALKLQGRPGDAAEAYLAAVARAPGLQQPLDELRMLGFSQRSIDAHIRASSAGYPARTPRAVAVHVESITKPDVRGAIQDVGPAHVTVEVGPLTRQDLPLAVVCRSGPEVVATRVIRADATANDPTSISASDLPGSIRFRIAIEANDASVLRIGFEPGGAEFSGSPFVLPGWKGASLLERLDELERRIDGVSDVADLARTLRAILLPELASLTAERVELALRDQRALFERQLVRTLGATGVVGLPAADRPRRLVFEADDGFPGIGWSPPHLGPDGRTRREPLPRGHVAAALAPGCGFVVVASLAGRLSEASLRRLAVRVGGLHVAQVLVPHDDPAGHHSLIALLPPAAAGPDGIVHCALECSPGASPAGISSIALETLDPIPPGAPEASGLLVHRAEGGSGSPVVLYWAFGTWPVEAGAAQLRIAGADLQSIAVNGTEIDALPRASTLEVPARCLFHDRPNLVAVRAIRSVDIAACEPTAELGSVRG